MSSSEVRRDSEQVLSRKCIILTLNNNQRLPQGSSLGPTLFSISTSELRSFPTVISNASAHLYADDIIIYIPAPDPSSGIESL